MAGLLRPDSAFVALHPQVVQQLGSTAANVLSYIAYVEGDDGTELTAAAISRGTGVSVSTVKRVTTRLREQGLLTAGRADPWHSVLTWHVAWNHPVIAGQSESVRMELSGVSECASRGEQDGTPLLSEQKEQPLEPHAAPAAAPPTSIIEEHTVSVPDSYQEPLLPAVGLTLVPAESGPPKTAQTLVARWVDGFRESNGGEDPPGPLMKRVAGQMRNLAKTCDGHEDWVAAYAASYSAGIQGRCDAVPLMAKRPTLPQRTRVTNAFARPELGAPSGAAAALAALQTPRALS